MIGLDIGTSSVKMAELSRAKEEIRLRQASVVPLKNQSKESVQAALHTVFKDYGVLPEHIRVSVFGSAVLIRRIKLPLMTPQELKGAIRFEAENHIPFSVNDCILDFQILSQHPQEKSMTVLLVAAKQDYIHERLKLLSGCGIEPEIIDVDILCLINAFEVLHRDKDSQNYGLLNIHHDVSSFAIVHENSPFLMREIATGGHAVTKALAKLKGISEEQAGKLKADQSQSNSKDLTLATQKGFEALAGELEQSVNYFENETGEELHSIWLSGGGAMAYSVAEVLSEQLGKQARLWDNTKSLVVEKAVKPAFLKRHATELNVAFGMALREK